jgi:hypothetical protein
MIVCKELDKSFDTREAMLKALYENRGNIISLKKAHIYKSYKKGQGLDLRYYHDETKKVYSCKELVAVEDFDKGYLYPVISNVNYMDSHKDVHLTNSMNRTVKHQKGKIHYVLDHKLETGKIIAYPKDVEMMIKEIPWKSLGKNFEGNTQVLLFKTKKQPYTPKEALQVIDLDLPTQHSIRMKYIEVSLGIKDRSKDWEDANKEWDDNIDKVVNKSVAEEDGYIWFVKELGIVSEGSMLPKGSNDATPLIYKPESAKSTSETEVELAEKALQQDQNNYYKSLF